MSDEPIKSSFSSFEEFCHREDPVYPQNQHGKFRCPCCLHYTLGGIACYDICPVCFWEDDGTDSQHAFTPNGCSLDEGRDNFRRCGASKEDMLKHCRPPLPEEKP